MDFSNLLLHVLAFCAPAVALALLLTAFSALAGGRRCTVSLFVTDCALLALAGLAVLVAGLMLFGRDGKMATYAVLVVVTGLVQWWRFHRLRR